MITPTPKRKRNARAIALGLPPETPDNVLQGYFYTMRAHNRIVAVKKEFDSGQSNPTTEPTEDPPSQE